MRRTKQITGILLSLMLLTGLFWPVRVHAAGTVTISVSSSTLNVGDQVTVTAWAAGPDGEKAIAKLGFNYDSGKLSFVSCSESSYSGGEGGYVGVSANTASITLKATAAGVAAVTVSGSNGVNVSDGTVEYGELTAGGTKLTVNNCTGAGNGQQNSNGTADDPADGTKSEDNSLASLKISPGTLSPAFQYSETNYTAAVGEDVTSISVDAKPSNEKATIESITGHTDLKPGQNTISITVKAENGTTATYKIVVTRGGAGETQTDNPEGETENPTPENTTENPQGITLNGHSFNLAASIPEDVIPQDFTKTTTTCNGQQAEGLLFDKAPLMLVYLTTPSTEVKNTLAVFEEASGAVYPFRKVEMGENYLILLNPPAEPGLSAEYTQAAGTLAGYENVPVFVNAAAAPAAAAPAENPEGEAAVPEGETAAPVQELPEFSLVYAASSHGNVGWYQYDAAENSFQRHVQAAAAPETPQESESGTDSVELQGLQSAYKDLEEQFNEKKESATRNTAIMVFVIAVLLVVIVNLILRGRGDDEEEYEEEEEFPPRQRKFLLSRRKSEDNEEDYEEEEERPKSRQGKKLSQETRPIRKPEPVKKPEPSGSGKIPGNPEPVIKSELPAGKGAPRGAESVRHPDIHRKLEIPRKIEPPRKVEPPKKLEPPRMMETKRKPEAPKGPDKPVMTDVRKNLELEDDFEVIDLEDL